MTGGNDGLAADIGRSFEGIGEDIVLAGTFVASMVGAFVVMFGVGIAVLVAGAIYVLGDAVLGLAGVGLPSTGALEGATNLVLALIVLAGPALVVGFTFLGESDDDGRLVERPSAALIVPVGLLGIGVAVAASTGTTRVAMGLLAFAGFVLASRTIGHYARDVNALSLPSWLRFALGSLAVLPVSVIGGIEQVDWLSRVTDNGSATSAYGDANDALAGVGVPDGLAVGAASFSAFELAVVGAPVVICGGYVLVQIAASVPRRRAGVRPGRPPAVQTQLDAARTTRRDADGDRANGESESAIERYDEAKDHYDAARRAAIERGYESDGKRIDDEIAGMAGDAAASLGDVVGQYRERAEDRIAAAESAAADGEHGTARETYESALSAIEDGIEAAEGLLGSPDRQPAKHSTVTAAWIDAYAPGDTGGIAGLRERRDEVERALANVETQAAETEIDDLLDEAEDGSTEAAELRAEGAYDDALRTCRNAREAAQWALSIARESAQNRESDAEAAVADLDEAIATTKRDEARERVRNLSGRVADRAAAAERYRDDGEYETAAGAYEAALERCEGAIEVAADAGLDERDSLVDRRDRLQTALAETEREEAVERARTAIEAGDDLFSTGDERRVVAEDAVDDGDYADAGDAFAEAGDAFAEAGERYADAAATLDGYDVAERDEAERKRERAAERRENAALSRVGQRINAATARTAREPADARETLATVIEDIEGLSSSLDRPDDVAVLESEARREYVRARIAEGRERIEATVDRFEAGDYGDALEGFEEALEFLRETEPEGDDGGDDRAELSELVDLCRHNADATRRAQHGLGDPDLRTPADLKSADEADAGDVGGRPTRAESAPTVTADRLVSEGDGAATPPDHERVERVGAGGSANVYRVRLEGTGKVAALKEPRIGGTMSTAVMESFAEEATLWAKLSESEHVVELLDWGAEPGPWLLSEYMEGGTLADRVGDLSPGAAVDALVDVSEAIRFAHQRAGYHMDLTPSNVMFTERGDREVAKVGDWGRGRAPFADDDRPGGATPAYAAPEQIEPDRFGGTGPHTDIYQLGVLVSETLTGRPPFAGETPREIAAAVLEDDPIPPTELDPSLPAGADDVVATAMARQPADRYDSVVLVRDALDGLDV